MSVAPPNPPARRVAVVGAGFSGVLTALHLLRGDPAIEVRLIEKAERFGPGRAYAAADPDHVLNVRAANMSAFADRPGHFVQWLAEQGHPASPDAFVRREVYGAYLQGLLREAIGEHSGRFLLEQDEAVAAEPSGRGFTLRFAMGRTLDIDALVLAVGLGPPRAAPGATPEALTSKAYRADPWRIDPDRLPAGEILLIGTGLTMVDAALRLDRPDRRFTAVSRRGLLPLDHAPTPPARPPEGSFDTPLEGLQTLRAHAAAVGWRAAVDSIRPLTPDIWVNWSPAERRRFLTRLRPWWDIHRHRMAPPVAARISGLRDAGRLQALAARIQRIEPDGQHLAVTWRRAGQVETKTFSAIVNCTGLSGDIDGSPLLRSLAAHGVLRPDALRLGADVDSRFRVLGPRGAPTPGLYAVGPLTRAARWETVAVPDLRSQTAEVASLVVLEAI